MLSAAIGGFAVRLVGLVALCWCVNWWGLLDCGCWCRLLGGFWWLFLFVAVFCFVFPLVLFCFVFVWVVAFRMALILRLGVTWLLYGVCVIVMVLYCVVVRVWCVCDCDFVLLVCGLIVSVLV